MEPAKARFMLLDQRNLKPRKIRYKLVGNDTEIVQE
jgi:hypothetical protein